ncbi:2OG-Fe(II)oxygenase superfamily protein, partial [Colletotrichum scovillei]
MLSVREGPSTSRRCSFSALRSAFFAALKSAGPGSNAGPGPSCGGHLLDASMPAVR